MEESTAISPEDVKKSYRPRIIDSVMKDALEVFGGVHVTGSKWCGKSWTGTYHAKSSLCIHSKDIAEFARLNPNKALDGEPPRLIDEWQIVPKLWDYARTMIDSSRSKGRFIFTGSVSPPEESTLHTGTGRFIHLKMHTMSLFESGLSTGAVSVADLFAGKSIETTDSDMTPVTAARFICRGGWPAGVDMNDDQAMKISRAYIQSLLEMDYRKLDGRRRSPKTMELLLRSLSRNCSATVNKSVLAKDMSRGGTPVKDETVDSYMDALRKTFVVDEQMAWGPELRTKARVRGAPKMHITDPCIAASILRADPERLVHDPNTEGLLFESLCYRDLCTYVLPLEGDVSYYRDNSGLEIDSIMELNNGRWGAFEVKLGTHDFEKAAENLKRLNKKVEEEASFLAILTASGNLAYTRDDGVHVIPMDCLGP